MKMDWAREVLDVCKHSNAAFFYKQDSAFRTETRPYLVSKDGRKLEYHQFPGEHTEPRLIEGPDPVDPLAVIP
jgi:protein gp37